MIEIVLAWRAATSCDECATPSSTMMKLETSSSVAVSFGRRRPNRITPSFDFHAPATITSPRTSSALTRIEPMIAVSATTSCPALSAKMTTKNSGRLPSVDCSTPVAAGPKLRPTCSVAKDTIQARPASAIAATTNARIAETPLA